MCFTHICITIIVLLMSHVINGDNSFQTFKDNTFFVVDMVQTKNVWFKGSRVIKPIVLQTKYGVQDCQALCVKEPKCNSLNIGKASSTEYFCELTEYHYLDTDIAKESQISTGNDNYSFKVKRTLKKKE